MRACQILLVDRIMYPVFQTEARGQLQPHHGFQPKQDLVLGDPSLGDQTVAMVPIVLGEHLPGRNLLPERDIAHGFQPLLDVLNVFKGNHRSSLSKPDPVMQIYGVIE